MTSTNLNIVVTWKMALWKLLKITCVLGATFTFYPSFATSLNQKSLIRYGLEHSPEFQSSKNQLEIYRLKTQNSFSNFLPSLDLSATHGYQDGDPTAPSTIWPNTLTLSLSEKIYDNGSNLAIYRIAKYDLEKAQIQFHKDRDKFCLDVVNEHNQYSKAQSLLKVQNFQFQLLKKQFLSIERKYKRGEKTRTEFLRFKAQLQRSNLSLKRAQNQVEISKASLKALIGWKDQILEISTAPIHPIDTLKTKYTPPPLKEHYEYKLSEKSRKINEETLALEGKKYGPQLFLNGGVTYQNSNYTAGGNSLSENGHTDWSILLTLKYNVWDWGQQRRNYSIAQLNKSNKNNSLDSVLLALKTELTKFTININQQRVNYQLSKDLVDLERINHTELQKDYRNGRATFLDLVNSVDNLTTSQELFYRNYFELSSSLAEYQFHKGHLYDSIFNR